MVLALFVLVEDEFAGAFDVWGGGGGGFQGAETGIAAGAEVCGLLVVLASELDDGGGFVAGLDREVDGVVGGRGGTCGGGREEQDEG
jgi:hypothetical protein